jgi:pimeloyl-ACP methyl ester carboxylesterase
VLLLHGFPEAAFVWDEVLLALAPPISGLAPNLRGYPGSSQPVEVAAYRAGTWWPTWWADRSHGRHPLDLLVAHDWGGAVAWNLAAQRPDLFKRLLIINSPHPAAFLRELRNNPAQQAASAYMNRLCQPDAETCWPSATLPACWPCPGEPAWLSPALREQYRQAWRQGLTGPLNYYRASPLRPPTGPAGRLAHADPEGR